MLQQIYFEKPYLPSEWEASTEAVVFARTPEALADFAADSQHRWRNPPASRTRPWTDDYTNLIGALWRNMRDGSPKQ